MIESTKIFLMIFGTNELHKATKETVLTL